MQDKCGKQPSEYDHRKRVEGKDRDGLYDSKIQPHVHEIKKICKLNGIPFICSCAVANISKNGEGVTVYRTDGVLPGSSDIELYEDRFVDFLLLLRGAKLAPIADVPLDEEGQDYINEPPMDEEPFEEPFMNEPVSDEDISDEELSDDSDLEGELTDGSNPVDTHDDMDDPGKLIDNEPVVPASSKDPVVEKEEEPEEKVVKKTRVSRKKPKVSRKKADEPEKTDAPVVKKEAKESVAAVPDRKVPDQRNNVPISSFSGLIDIGDL